MSWINHLPPAGWSTFWKSNFKQQLGCRFDIIDNESYLFVFWHMQLYMSWYMRSFFGFTFLNILYFFKYSCTNIFHKGSLYTFYQTRLNISPANFANTVLSIKSKVTCIQILFCFDMLRLNHQMLLHSSDLYKLILQGCFTGTGTITIMVIVPVPERQPWRICLYRLQIG